VSDELHRAIVAPAAFALAVRYFRGEGLPVLAAAAARMEAEARAELARFRTVDASSSAPEPSGRERLGVSTRQAHQLTGASEEFLRRLARNGELAAWRVEATGEWQFDREAVEAYAARRRSA
jgi:excisionase family DNA binding protein